MKPTMKAPGSKRLNLEHDKLVSNFAFKFNLRRYSEGLYEGILQEVQLAPFFSAALLGVPRTLDDLPSLDPELHRSLLQVARYNGRGLHSSTFRLNLSASCGTGGAYSYRET
jgi:hypothetical protein